MNKKEAYEKYMVALSNFNNAQGEWVDVAALELEAAKKAFNIVIKEAINSATTLPN
jgi:hypothetical protein